jgi:hypothetical protein
MVITTSGRRSKGVWPADGEDDICKKEVRVMVMAAMRAMTTRVAGERR